MVTTHAALALNEHPNLKRVPMNSRQASRVQTGPFGLSFVDGDKLYRPVRKAGGMASSNEHLWATPTTNALERATDSHSQSQAERIHLKTHAGPISLQKFGAAKITIPGDINKPVFLKKLTQFLYDELRIIGAHRYSRII
jgi:hypothetical protein